MLVCAAFPAAADEFEDRVRAFILDNPEIILEALALIGERERAAETAARLEPYADMFTEQARHGIGQPDAPVRVIEFFDYRCVPCKAMHPKLVDFVKEHPDVRIEMRHLPILSPGSERGARFALAVREVYGDDLYAKAHDRIWNLRGPLNQAGFARIAADLGLDFAQISEAMDSDVVTARIDGNRDAAIALEILGTPAFLTPTSVLFGDTDVDTLAETWLNR